MSTIDAPGSISHSRERYGLDMGSAEVLAFALHQVSVQMQQALVRSAFSAVVRDIQDCASGINLKTEHGWETIAGSGPSLHAVGSGHVCNFVMEEYGEENIRPGDVIFHNDPWRGVVHQSDVSVLRPVFVDDELTFILETNSHLVDTGGPIAGGYPTGAKSTYEESLRIPPMLLYAEDVANRGLFNFILESTRVAPLNLGDLRALYGALVVGDRLLQDLCRREMRTRVVKAGLYALDTAEANMRAAIAKLPDGDYPAEDVIDDDGITADSMRLRAELKVRGDMMEIDFSGTERQAVGNCTTAWCESTRAFIVAKMMLDPEGIYNGGALRPYHAVLPPGSLVAGLPPTSVSDHGTVGLRVTNVVQQAMNAAVSDDDKVAPDSGNTIFFGMQGLDTRPGKNSAPFGSFVLPGTPWGASSTTDGLGFTGPLVGGGVARSSVWEHIESDVPVVFWDHEYMIDSAGAGKHRGGVGSYCVVEALARVEITCVADRVQVGAPGVNGAGRGMPGLAFILDKPEGSKAPFPNWNGVVPVSELTPLFGRFDDDGRPDPIAGKVGNGALYDVSKFSGYFLEAGQVLLVIGGGSGGWGDPLDRDPQLVLNDVLDEVVSPEAARDDYGVQLAVDGGRVVVDEESTKDRRACLANGSREPQTACFRPWPLGREEWKQLSRPVIERVAELAG
jgi:N-methylhydantoinase B